MTLTFKSIKPAATLFEYLTDMQKFVSVHPVISKIDALGGNNYLVHETLTLGSIPLAFTYPFTLEINQADKTVMMQATVMKLTKIKINIRIKEENGVSMIEDSVEFKSFLPVRSAMEKIFKEQHAKLFKNIEVD